MKKLAVIDDEIDFCMLVKIYCSRKGIECRYARTLEEGAVLLDEFTPDLLILDNNLPDGYGWQQVPTLLERYPQIVIHLITAKNLPERNEVSLQNSTRVFRHFKPLSLAQLNGIINSIVPSIHNLCD